MSRKTGRNDPCPCGSGKKYKRCCLNKERSQQRQRLISGRAVERAFDWIDQHRSKAFHAALHEQYFAGLEEDFWEEIAQLSPELADMFESNAAEWCLVDGRDLASSESPAPRFIELVLRQPLAQDEREYLKLLAQARLDLYEVDETEPGEGVWMVPVLEEKRRRIRVQETSASHILQPGDIVGARLVGADPAVFSGAMYPFEQPQYLEIRDRVFKQKGRSKRPDAEWVNRCIVDQWLRVLAGPAPSILDASTGDPILLTTLLYRVHDWDELRRLLESQKDVAKEDEDAWVRLSPEDPDRPLCSLSRKSGNLEAFARTSALADEADDWLVELAGEWLGHPDVSIADPRQLWKERHHEPSSPHDDLMSNKRARSFTMTEPPRARCGPGRQGCGQPPGRSSSGPGRRG
ncbi:MAG TPA: SEC-C metal-binding domain-containing protein [Acidobacteriota bacterium]|nr:SEC-C metal-binding domain-containing protein [Acidobacteriota bacterium]